MKLLATDMDGTFLRDDKSYSEEFNDLYKQMLKQDIQFVIASGNQYEALACKFDEEIKNDLYYLCENGTKIVYQGKTLYKKALEKQDAQEVLDILKEDQEYDYRHRAICPRCASLIETPDSVKLQRVWATLVAGIIMLFPANLLPISGVYLTGSLSQDTLMSGVMSFISMGSYFVAFVVFFASIFVPVSKILIMLYLLASVHFKWRHSIKWQMRLLHIIHFVGRWSMLDLFVLALMMSLVTRGQIINFTVGPAAFYFGAAVFLTMISTSQFDSRLIWKIYDRKQ